MQKIITFSYEGCIVPIEILDKFWMVNLTTIAKRFNMRVDNYMFYPQLGAKLIHMHSLSKHPTMRDTKKGEPGMPGTWYHYLAASYIAEWLDKDFFFWLLMCYNDILCEYSSTFNLEANEPEQFVLSVLTKVDNDMTLEEFCKKHSVQLDCKCDLGVICYKTGIPCDQFITNDLANEFGFTPIELILRLHNLKIIERFEGKWLLTSKYQGKGLRESFDSVIDIF